MSCGGCASSVKRILESQVLSDFGFFVFYGEANTRVT
jgi:NAD(P)H-nitrite reductase large subunit